MQWTGYKFVYDFISNDYKLKFHAMKIVRYTFIVAFLFAEIGTAQNWTEVNKVVAADRGAADQFGIAVSLDGEYAVFGALEDDEDENGNNTLNNAGAAYVFKKNVNGNWEQLQKIVAQDREIFDFFGSSVAMAGNTLIVGSPSEDDDENGNNAMQLSGSAYIFEKDGNGTWHQVQKIVASDRSEESYFGNAVAIDGDRLVVGSFRNEPQGEPSGSNYGAAYVFEKNSNGVWQEVEKLIAPDAAPGDIFGYSVAISNNTVLIGAYTESEDPNGNNTLQAAGSAYFFERAGNGNWDFAQKIVPSDRRALDQFGFSLSLLGNRSLISAITQDYDASGNNNITDTGAAYLFERNSSGVWIETQKIAASDRDFNDQFGSSVSLGPSRLVVGARFEDEDPNGNNPLSVAGSAYVFQKMTNGDWQEIQKIVASDREAADAFATSVSISGNTICLGAPLEDDDVNGNNELPDAGSAYFFSDPTLGISGAENTSPMVYYPNPTKSEVFINTSGLSGMIEISQYSMDGRLMTSEKYISESRVLYSVKGPAGLYLLKITHDEKPIETLKILKQ